MIFCRSTGDFSLDREYVTNRDSVHARSSVEFPAVRIRNDAFRLSGSRLARCSKFGLIRQGAQRAKLARLDSGAVPQINRRTDNQWK